MFGFVMYRVFWVLELIVLCILIEMNRGCIFCFCEVGEGWEGCGEFGKVCGWLYSLCGF